MTTVYNQQAAPAPAEGRTPGVPGGRRTPAFPKRHAIGGFLIEHTVWLLLVLFVVAASQVSAFFFTVANLNNLLIQATVLGLLALGVAHTLIIGEIDLSIVGNLGFSAAVGALLLTELGWSSPVVIVAVLGVGAAIGLFNGVLVAYLHVNSLIGTLAVGLTLGGATLALTRGRSISGLPDQYTWIGSARLLDWPLMPVVFLAMYAVAALWLQRTRTGRSMFAVGGNVTAAHAAGINVARTRLMAFLVSGLFAGLSGYLISAWLKAVSQTMGADLLLYAIAAPIIGGVSIRGGVARVLGILGGVLLITSVNVGLQIVRIEPFYVELIGGVLILSAVLFDSVRNRYQRSY